jgi:hypothetical protein
MHPTSGSSLFLALYVLAMIPLVALYIRRGIRKRRQWTDQLHAALTPHGPYCPVCGHNYPHPKCARCIRTQAADWK